MIRCNQRQKIQNEYRNLSEAKKSLLKGKLTTIKNFVIKTTKKTDTAPEEVTTRLQAAEDIYAKFQGLSQQLLTSKIEFNPRDQSENDEIDEQYYVYNKGSLITIIGET